MGSQLRKFLWDSWRALHGELEKGEGRSYPVIKTTRLENPNPFQCVWRVTQIFFWWKFGWCFAKYLHCRCVLFLIEWIYIYARLALYRLRLIESAISLSVAVRDLIYSRISIRETEVGNSLAANCANSNEWGKRGNECSNWLTNCETTEKQLKLYRKKRRKKKSRLKHYNKSQQKVKVKSSSRSWQSELNCQKVNQSHCRRAKKETNDKPR